MGQMKNIAIIMSESGMTEREAINFVLQKRRNAMQLKDEAEMRDDEVQAWDKIKLELDCAITDLMAFLETNPPNMMVVSCRDRLKTIRESIWQRRGSQ